MPDFSKTFDDDRLKFRRELFQRFLESSYWEAGMDDEKMTRRFHLYVCDTFYNLLDDQKESIVDNPEPIEGAIV